MVRPMGRTRTSWDRLLLLQGLALLFVLAACAPAAPAGAPTPAARLHFYEFYSPT